MPIKTRMDYEVELMAEKIPGCQGVYEDIGPHLIHVSKWLIDNLIDARIKIDELERASSPLPVPGPVIEALVKRLAIIVNENAQLRSDIARLSALVSGGFLLHQRRKR